MLFDFFDQFLLADKYKTGSFYFEALERRKRKYIFVTISPSLLVAFFERSTFFAISYCRFLNLRHLSKNVPDAGSRLLVFFDILCKLCFLSENSKTLFFFC